MLEDFIETNEIMAEIKVFDVEVKTSAQAELAEQSHPVVKTIVLAHDKGFVLAILLATQKVDFSAIAHLLKTAHVRLATPGEVEEVPGYEVGAVPPISIYGTPSLIDPAVFNHPWVLAGGGTKFALLKMQSKDILTHAYEPLVEKIALPPATR
ncbi:MAG: YbaK/EbsC family protein [archaeon]